ncbi:MAG: chloride channel protein [Hyphomicrobiaceae bacterium]|nr:chloride channel protein [Hyphomicrobiaceae bacterium]MCC0011311.1 chloride channel protein [Hyphomicrobiaceae bacterium]
MHDSEQTKTDTPKARSRLARYRDEREQAREQNPRSLAAVARESVQNAIFERFQHNFSDFIGDRQPLTWALGLGIGIAVGYAALGFRKLIGVFQLPWLMTTSERVASAAAEVPWWVILLAPAVGGLIVGFILQHFVAGQRAHAVADVIEYRSLRDCRIDPKTGLISALLAAMSLGAGASAGREGPVVHLGATLASWLEYRFHLSPANRRTLLASGVAAAVAASFNAPIAGVLFAHEVILRHYAMRAFVPIVIASVTGGVISRIHLGNFPAFTIPDYQITSFLEVPAFALLGVTCAAVAILFQFTIIASERIVWHFESPLWLRTALGGLAVGAIAIVFPEVLGVGYETTDRALYMSLPLWMLLALIVAKTLATAITLAVRFAGGIFSPSLYLGALTGAAFGIVATTAFPEVGASYGLYAILGMGAVAACVLGAPISTILICFELTSGYELSLALLLTVSIAVGLNQALLGQSYFDWQLAKRGLFLQEGPHKSIMRRLTVSGFMSERSDKADKKHLAADSEEPWLLPSDTLERALRTFDRSGKARVAVVSENDQSLIIGWAERMHALNAFNKALIDAHVEEHR